MRALLIAGLCPNPSFADLDISPLLDLSIGASNPPTHSFSEETTALYGVRAMAWLCTSGR